MTSNQRAIFHLEERVVASRNPRLLAFNEKLGVVAATGHFVSQLAARISQPESAALFGIERYQAVGCDRCSDQIAIGLNRNGTGSVGRLFHQHARERNLFGVPWSQPGTAAVAGFKKDRLALARLDRLWQLDHKTSVIVGSIRVVGQRLLVRAMQSVQLPVGRQLECE